MIARKGVMSWHVLMLLVLIAGVGFRLYHLDKKVIWMDEAASKLLLSGYSKVEMQAELSIKPVWSVTEYARFQTVGAERGTVETVQALAHDDPQHPPLFYALLRIWAGFFGDSIQSLRFFSALLSLLCVPALWWFCRELFRDEPHAPLITSIALGLVMISPFHIHYAQEARQYGFLTALFLFSSAGLLYALRTGNFRSWLLYGFGLLLGFYTHTLFVLMWLAHAAIVFAFAFLLPQEQMVETKSDSSKQPAKPWLAFIGATLVVGLLFLPWMLSLWKGKASASYGTVWVHASIGTIQLVKTWMFNIGNLFLDVNHNQLEASFWSANPAVTKVVRFARFCVVLLPFFACYSIWKIAPRRTALVICLLTLIPFLAFAFPDIIFGGRRSTIPRFMIPCYLGIQIAVAYYLALRIAQSSRQVLWGGVLGLLVCGALISNVIGSQAQVWWTKSVSWSLPRVAEVVNAEQRPLLVAFTENQLLAATDLFDPEVRIFNLQQFPLQNSEQVVREIRQSIRNQQPGAVYFFNLRPGEIADIEEQGVVLDATYKSYNLWRVEKFENKLVHTHPPKEPVARHKIDRVMPHDFS